MGEPLPFYDTCVRIGHSRAPDPPGNVAGVAELRAEMARLGIAASAVEHAVAREASPRLGHELLAEALADEPSLRPAWHFMPALSDRIERAYTDPAELLEADVALGRVDAQDFLAGGGDRACFAPVLEACSAIRLPVFLDFRSQGNVGSFDFDLCRRWPNVPFVIEGFGGYPLHRVVWCLREYPNLYLSTVRLAVFHAVPLLCDLVGPEKLIYGSNWPAETMGLSMGVVLLADVDPAIRRLVAGDNFRRLLGRVGPEEAQP